MKILIFALIILQVNCSKAKFFSEKEVPQIIRNHK